MEQQEKNEIRLELPEKVRQIIEQIQKHGFEAYAVGGCVRDSLLGRTPDDWDITTSAKPQEVKAIFPRTIDTGIEHGTVTVMMGKEGFEVTTYRIDGAYLDGRHPESVEFSSNLVEDLKRRDFTINAMAYNEQQGLVDVFEGIEDMQRKVIRCVGNPKERFGEDALRMMRAIRFSAQLGFEIDEETKEGMKLLAPTLENISAERIQVELVKMLTSDRPELIRTAYELGITKVFLPEFDRMMETKQETLHHMYTVGEHTIHAMMNVRNDKILRLTMLLHDTGKPEYKTMDEDGVAHFKMHALGSEQIAKEVLRRLKFDNDTLHKVTRLVLNHDYRMPAVPKNVRRAMNKIGEDIFPYYMEVRRADVLAQSEYRRAEKLKNLDEVEQTYAEIIEKGQCVSLKELAVTGRDLIRVGMKPGKEIGEKLNELLNLVIENPEMNTRETLLNYISTDKEV